MRTAKPFAMAAAFVLVFSVVLSVFLFGFASSAEARYSRNYGEHSGYLSSLEGEKTLVVNDLVIIGPPAALGPPLQDRIFTVKLSKEFREQYNEKFGRTEVEQVYHASNHYSYYDEMWGVGGSVQDVNEERRKFADYMLKRLAEFHVDNYAQNDPQARVVWEAKERLSNLNVEVSRFRFDMNYQLAGNTLEVRVVNPWITSAKVRMQMAGFGSFDETTISLASPFVQKITLEGHYAMVDGIVTFIGRRPLARSLSGSLTTSTFTRDSGVSIRQSLYLAGLSYSF